MSELVEVLDVPVPPVSTNITVKFKLHQFQTIAQVYPNHLKLDAIKEDLAGKFKVPAKYLHLLQDGISLSDSVRLSEMPHNNFYIVEMDLELNSEAHKLNENVKSHEKLIALNADVFYSHYHMPEFFSVHISNDADVNIAAKRLIVEIINRPAKKPFFGGYRNRKTDIEYHDAVSQTGPHEDTIKWDGLVTRDSQTVEQKNTSDDIHYDRTNQAFGSATELINVPAVTDYTITPKPYETYDQMEKRLKKLDKIVLIQRNFRRYMWQRLIKKSAAEWRSLVLEQRHREKSRHDQYINDFKAECVVKTFPKTREDFNVLYVQIQAWKDIELKRIKELYSGGSRISEINSLLDKEIQMLNAVERKWFKIRKNLKELKQEKELDKIGAPIKWVGYKNIVCEMDSLRTQKVRKLTKLYRQMKMKLSQDNRLQLIGNVLEMINQEETSKPLVELQELLCRERSLITCNVKNVTLMAMRMRQNLLFVDFIKDLGRASDRTEYKVKKVLCKQCKSVKGVSDFELYTRQGGVSICKQCAFLKVPPVDVTLYRAILRAIQRDERKRKALASFAFIVQEEDIREIVEMIWHGHSILSQCDTRKEIRLPRWNRGEDWSPWNCICLTEEEARTHTKIVNVTDLYDDYMLADIRKKHFQARVSFKKLLNVNEDYLESGEWWQVGINEKQV